LEEDDFHSKASVRIILKAQQGISVQRMSSVWNWGLVICNCVRLQTLFWMWDFLSFHIMVGG